MRAIFIIICFILSFKGFAQNSGGAIVQEMVQRAKSLMHQQDYAKSFEAWQTALKELQNIPDHAGSIEALSQLAYLSTLVDDKVDAGIAEAQQAIDLAAAHQLENLAVLDQPYWILSQYYLDIDKNKALQYADKTLSLTTDVGLQEEVQIYQIELLANLDRFSEADQLIEQLKQKDLSLFNDISFSYAQATLAYSQRNNQKAILLIENALEQLEQQQDYPLEKQAKFHDLLGGCYSTIYEFDKGIVAQNKAIELAEKSSSDKCALKGYYHNLAFVYMDKGLYLKDKAVLKKAIQHYQEAIDAAYDYCSDFSLHEEYHMLAYTLYSIGDYEATIVAMDSSLHYAKSANDQHVILENYGLASLAYNRLEAYDLALSYNQKALITVVPEFENEDYAVNPSFFHTENYFNIGLQLYYKANVLYTKLKESTEPDVKNLHLLVETINLAVEFFNEQRKDLAGFDESKQSFRKNLTNVFNLQFIAANMLYESTGTRTDLEAVFQRFEESKALVLLESLPVISEVLPEDWVTQEMELRTRQFDLQNQLLNAQRASLTDSVSYFQTALLTANEQYETFIESTRKEQPNFIAARFENKSFDLSSLQKDLNQEEVLIGYRVIRSPKELYILYITKTESGVIKVIPNDDFFEDCSTLQQLVKNPLLIQKSKRESFVELSNKLYQQLLQPIETKMLGKDKIVVVPDGTLSFIPFEVLTKQNESGQFSELSYLIKTHQISYHYSATAYQQLKLKTPIVDQSMLAFAPVFEGTDQALIANRQEDFLVDTLYRAVKDGAFLPLPNTKEEVQQISKLLSSNTTILLEQEATKNNLLAQLQKQAYQFVHIATHGLVNFQNPKLSALACYPEDESTSLLTANEIQARDIAVDLVILSSCESGIGQIIEGEGIIAMNRSFVYAGAKNVLFSLWKVNDQYTADLMIDFYKNYLTTKDYSQALRLAKLKMLEDPTTANPRFWAPFVLIGE